MVQEGEGEVPDYGKDKDTMLTEWVRVKDYVLGGLKPPEKDATGKIRFTPP